jgi:hypothetical protein
VSKNTWEKEARKGGFLGQNSHNGDKRKSNAKGTKDFILFHFI